MLGPPRPVDTLLVGGEVVVEGGELRTADPAVAGRRPRARERAAWRSARRERAATGHRPGAAASASASARTDGRAEGHRRVRVRVRPARRATCSSASRLRSPHASARIRGIDTARGARAPRRRTPCSPTPTSRAQAASAPARTRTSPCSPFDRVRYHGEPVAVVAADDLATARRAAALVAVDYEPLRAADDRRGGARADGAPRLHPDGNALRSRAHPPRRPGRRPPPGAVVVRGDLRGRHPGPGVPRAGGRAGPAAAPTAASSSRSRPSGCTSTASRWPRRSGSPEERSGSCWPASAARSAGARTSRSTSTRACSRCATGRPVKMAYAREESFVRPRAPPPGADGVRARRRRGRAAARACARGCVFDGGAYASSSTAVIANAATLACGPYAVPNAPRRGHRRLHEQPAVRGDARLRRAAGRDRLRGADGPARGARSAWTRSSCGGATRCAPGGEMPTGQRLRGPVDARRAARGAGGAAAAARAGRATRATLPGGPFGADRRRGRARAASATPYGFKNIAFSEGFDDAAVARVRLSAATATGRPRCTPRRPRSGRASLGVCEQIARTELGVERVRVLPADTAVGSAGSASASRLTWMLGGAVHAACRARARSALGLTARTADALAGEPACRRARGDLPPPADRPDGRPHGRGDVHAGFAFVAHRAVVDVDVELGIARVVQLACAQDVGRAINPLALEGQLEGGGVQGLGPGADGGAARRRTGWSSTARSASTGSRRSSTRPSCRPSILELEHPDAPYGVTGVGRDGVDHLDAGGARRAARRDRPAR